MLFQFTDEQNLIREGVKDVCKKFPPKYWRECDRKKSYPEEFVRELTTGGWLAALIPKEFDGSGLGLTEACIILEEINRSGANGAACHAQMYTMGAVLRHGSQEQKRKYLPQIAKGTLRLQAFAVTEPNAGVDTTRITTFAKKEDDQYILNGQKIFISRVQHSDLMLVLARTKAYEDVQKKTEGISLFLIDLRENKGNIQVQPIETMINHETNTVYFQDVAVPANSLVGEEGRGFYYILDGINAERILIASEAIGDARWFIDQAVNYANNRIVFNRPIGQNQGVQFPIAKAFADIEAADLMRYKAAGLFDAGKPCGREANLSKLLASEASWTAANVAMTTLGGYGMTADFDVERKFRDTRLLLVAPIPNNLILSYLAEHVLHLPRSY